MNGWAIGAIAAGVIAVWFILGLLAGVYVGRILRHGSQILEDMDRNHDG